LGVVVVRLSWLLISLVIWLYSGAQLRAVFRSIDDPYAVTMARRELAMRRRLPTAAHVACGICMLSASAGAGVLAAATSHEPGAHCWRMPESGSMHPSAAIRRGCGRSAG
jgi:hypothetical protein